MVLGRKIYLHKQDGTVSDYYDRLEDLERRLDGRFFKCHRSYLVNLDYVRGCRDGRVLLSQGEPIPASRLRERELTQAAQAQKVYIAEAQARYEQTKSFRHDVKNHLSVLDGLLRSGKMEEGRAYLKKLEAVSEALSFPYQTGNPVVDILLGEKLGLAKEIAAEVSLILPKPCGIDDFDLCVLFANALDNAITACRGSVGAKAIRVSGKQQGDFYMLTFENTCPDGPIPPAGTGLSNIKAVAEKVPRGDADGENRGAVLSERADEHILRYVLTS